MRAHDFIKELVATGMPEMQAEAIARVNEARDYDDDPLWDSDAAVAALVESGLPAKQAGILVRFRDSMREAGAAS